MKITSSRFESAAYGPEGEPRSPGPEAVFLGRSNVGKSSLINKLLGTRGLARTSSQPGRTQSVNYYLVNESLRFVDLPGYGYAKVPESVRRTWGPLVEGVLDRRREQIALALLVVDARRKPTKLDLVMRDWLKTKEIPYLVAATKSDKLSGNARTRSSRELREAFDDEQQTMILVSSSTGRGVREIWRELDRAFAHKEGR